MVSLCIFFCGLLFSLFTLHTWLVNIGNLCIPSSLFLEGVSISCAINVVFVQPIYTVVQYGQLII